MPSKTFKIKDLGQVVGGGTPSTSNPEYYGGDIPWLSPKDLSDYKKRYIKRGEKNITKLGLDNSSARLMPAGTVLLSSRAPIGYLAIAANEICTNQGFKSIIPDKKIVNSEFLYYCLKNQIEEIKDLGVGTTFAEISGKVLENYEINLPKLDYQEKVVSILSSIDEKIELNQLINDNLEAQIKSIFLKTIDSAEVNVKFGSIIKIGSGGTPKTSVPEYWGDEIPFFSPKDVDGMHVYSTEKRISKLGLDNCNSGLYPKDTTFITARGTVGKIALSACNMAMNQSCYAITASVAGQEHYIHQLSLYAVESIKQKSNGAVFDAINAKDITEELVPNLDSESICLFERSVTPLYEMIWSNGRENESLIKIRDHLLPKLMSGDIDVSSLEIPS